MDKIKIARELLGIARRITARELWPGIDERMLEKAVESTMSEHVEDFFDRNEAGFVTIEYSWSGGYSRQTRWEPAEYPELELEGIGIDYSMPKPVSLQRFLESVIRHLKNYDRDIEIEPGQIQRNRDMMKVISDQMDVWKEKDARLEMEMGPDIEVTLEKEGDFIQGNKVVFDYRLPKEGEKELVEAIYDDPESFAPPPEPDY